jgi:hemerythrin-like domain-containing protein
LEVIQIQASGHQDSVPEGPIEHLLACHRRIEQRLATLERAGEALQAIQNSLQFLETSGTLHTVDEEESFFPRLRPALSADESAYVESLESEHREAEALYASLKECISRIDTDRYRDLVAQFAGLYRRHIASEDKVFVELGRKVLTRAQLSDIQTEMRARRRP